MIVAFLCNDLLQSTLLSIWWIDVIFVGVSKKKIENWWHTNIGKKICFFHFFICSFVNMSHIKRNMYITSYYTVRHTKITILYRLRLTQPIFLFVSIASGLCFPQWRFTPSDRALTNLMRAVKNMYEYDFLSNSI